jgi:hypothetical protein
MEDEMLTREAFEQMTDEEKNQAYAEANEEDKPQIFAWFNEIRPIVEDSIPINPKTERLLAQERAVEQMPDTSSLEAEIRARVWATPANSQLAENRIRAARGNMLRKLQKKFRTYQQFTTQRAALETRTDPHTMAGYLASEAAKDGTQIGYDEETKQYFIKSLFEI